MKPTEDAGPPTEKTHTTATTTTNGGTPLCEIVTGPDMRSIAEALLYLQRLKQILEYLEPGAQTHSLTAYRWALVAIAALTAFGIFRMTTWLLRTRVGVLRAAARGEDVPVSIVAHKWDLLGTGEFRVVSAALLGDRAQQPEPDRGVEPVTDPVPGTARVIPRR